ncbi:hypothetical protein [Natrinema hispanicum]|uniref:Uncharacterized protein n=1 Tax=Natrinema hispanicum TaxID=392421 RepID=A0A1I0IXG7_9EURY|nr:hypothetical protein [Natrinema hispanicum]SEU01378.1 hypothetical protein SAMN04488694_12652 [Natrinema hispanicum]
MTRRRLSEIARERAAEFDSGICNNRVHESLQGQHDHGPDLERHINVIESVYELAYSYDDEDRSERKFDIFGAAEDINDHIDDVVDEVIAATLADLLEVVDGWGDVWDDDEIAAAKHEAREWLQEHSEAAERAGVWGEVTA